MKKDSVFYKVFSRVNNEQDFTIGNFHNYENAKNYCKQNYHIDRGIPNPYFDFETVEQGCKSDIAVIAQIETALRTMGRPVTISELQNEVEEKAQYSNQKLSALLNRMPNVVKTTEKKKSYFSIAE